MMVLTTCMGYSSGSTDDTNVSEEEGSNSEGLELHICHLQTTEWIWRHQSTWCGWFLKLFESGRQNKNSKTGEKPAGAASFESKSPSSASSEETSAAKPQKLKTALSSELRWKRKYDVFVCHSSAQKDTEEAKRLVSFLETPPRSLRCFLWHRDSCPGSAIATEFCKALENSHLRALLITPSFVQDDWCSYMMHQTLAERPMSNTMIPLLLDLAHSQYPQELRFYYYIDLSRNPDYGFNVVNKTVQSYLEKLIQSEEKLNYSLGDSSDPVHQMEETTRKKAT